MNITNFTPGVIPSAAYSNLRDVSASDAENVRNDAEGALIVRPGFRELPADAEQVVAVFAHEGYVLGVTADGELKWDRESHLLDPASTTGFRSFIPARTGFDTTQRVQFIAYDAVVFVSNANTQLKVIFHEDSQLIQNQVEAYPFYLPPPVIAQIGWTGGNIVYTYTPYVDRAVGARTGPNRFIDAFASAPAGAAVGASYYDTTAQKWYRYRVARRGAGAWGEMDPPSGWVGHYPSREAFAASGRIGIVFTGETVEVANRNTGTDPVYVRAQLIKTLNQDAATYDAYPIEAVGRSTLLGEMPSDTAIEFVITSVSLLDTDADFLDIFQTETTAENADAEYYYIGRIPYAVGTYQVSTQTDTAIENERVLIEPVETPAWTIVEATEERLYMATGDDNRVYMTHYDTSEQYLRSVTDYFPVKTDGRAITGIKLINENLLAIYTENKIYMVATDPIAELHRVIQTITSRDHRDAPIGCIAPESLVDIDGEHYFLSGTKQVYKFAGQRPVWVSEPINPMLEKMPRAVASEAVGFARDMEYCLSYASAPESRGNDAMVCYHTKYRTWWKDSLNLTGISKGQTQQEYAVINRTPVLLNTGTSDMDGIPIQWSWKGNKILLPLNTLIHSLFIGVLPEDIGDESVTVGVMLKTEEGEQTGELEVHRGLNFWEQFIGFNLRGRSVQVTLSGEGAMKIDRLTFNPEV